ncbi:MAG: peptidase C60 sortase A and B [Parcubacteria group bacterium Athens0416_74]|nr:MAG: peptidase C60 sortase A and B [Parcubacteria group bacterium Athens0416_74]
MDVKLLSMKRKLVFLITLIALVAFGATLVRATWYAPESEVPVPSPEESALLGSVSTTSQPARLTVPSLEIDADIQYVGVTKDGNMGVPSNFSDVGWYKYGTIPGRYGSAVIDGHVDNAIGLAGVFKKLDSIQVGESVYVQTKGGEKLRFIVTEVVTYGYKDVPVETLFNRKDARRLNLITCGGSWIQTEKTYDERTVVYTVLAP